MERRTRSANAKYRKHAGGYDATTGRTRRIRRRTIELLRLGAGDTVVDVGCGTGLSFAQLEEGIGERGRLIGVEQSPDMLAIARRRVAACGWSNVTLIESPAEEAAIPGPVDAVLFHFAHDILRSSAALDNVLARARPGARVAAAGMQYLPWWLLPANLIILAKARPYVASLEGLGQPWSLLGPRLDAVHTETALLGSCFIAHGRIAAESRS